MTSWQLYWITRMDGLKTFFIIAASLGLILSFVNIFIMNDHQMNLSFPKLYNHDVEIEKIALCKRRLVISLTGAMFAILCAVFTPCTNTMAAMIVLPKLTNAVRNNQELQKLPNSILELVNAWIEKLKPQSDK